MRHYLPNIESDKRPQIIQIQYVRSEGKTERKTLCLDTEEVFDCAL